ncbi:10844_t:CDS:2 [Ambispora gerdemannii]|uniref:10844_t:CDS:1 n=1 Tax=Ambispora gerdemannii TaxID=144530 RepID=A0A9N9DXP3_9GLOM|nr:10844_t:CDS:2 [Ambispora gerdemannii]
MIFRKSITAAVLASSLFLFAPVNVKAAPNVTIAQLANETSTLTLSTLFKLVTSPGQEAIAKALSDPASNLTVFAPTDDAFAGVNASNAKLVNAILNYHIVQGNYSVESLKSGVNLVQTFLNETLANLPQGQYQVVQVNKTGDAVKVNDATVVKPSLFAINGVVHVIDKVLIPPEKSTKVAKRAGLTQFVAALVKTKLDVVVDTIKGVTIFAPVDDAFLKSNASILNETTLAAILKLHVVSDIVGYSAGLKDGQNFSTVAENATVTIKISNGTVSVNGAKVLIPDVLVENGVIHVIDSVITTSSNATNTTKPVGSSTTNSTTSDNKSNTTGTNNSSASSVTSVFSVGFIATLFAVSVSLVAF